MSFVIIWRNSLLSSELIDLKTVDLKRNVVPKGNLGLVLRYKPFVLKVS